MRKNNFPDALPSSAAIFDSPTRSSLIAQLYSRAHYELPESNLATVLPFSA